MRGGTGRRDGEERQGGRDGEERQGGETGRKRQGDGTTRERPAATHEQVLSPLREECERLWAAVVGGLSSPSHGRAPRRALAADAAGAAVCERDLRAVSSRVTSRGSGAWALPQGEFGLDVIALIGQLRAREQRSVPQIHQTLQERGVAIAERSVTVLLHRYEELVALRLGDPVRLRERLAGRMG